MGMQHSSHDHGNAPPAPDKVDFHGMAVIGDDAIFASHLPMFMGSHGYQLIMHVSFGAAESVYRKDRKANPESRFYTLTPEKFALPDLFPGDGGTARRTSFSSGLVRNHFEEPEAHPERSEEIAADVAVKVLGVVHHRKLARDGERPRELRYLLFGKGGERFLAHLIHRHPDFDQLVAVTVTGAELSDDALLDGVEVTVAGRKDDPDERIAEGDEVPATATVGGKATKVNLRADAELYFDTFDLGM